MSKGILALIASLVLTFAVVCGEVAAATRILSGPLAKVDIKAAVIEGAKGKPRGTLTIAQHFALDPG